MGFSTCWNTAGTYLARMHDMSFVKHRRTILLGAWISWTFYSEHLALHPHPGFHLLARNSSLLGLSVVPDWKALLHHLFCHSSCLLSPMEEVSSKEKYHSFKILISPPWLSPGRVHDTAPWDCVCSWAAQGWHFMLGGDSRLESKWNLCKQTLLP